MWGRPASPCHFFTGRHPNASQQGPPSLKSHRWQPHCRGIRVRFLVFLTTYLHTPPPLLWRRTRHYRPSRISFPSLSCSGFGRGTWHQGLGWPGVFPQSMSIQGLAMELVRDAWWHLKHGSQLHWELVTRVEPPVFLRKRQRSSCWNELLVS